MSVPLVILAALGRDGTVVFSENRAAAQVLLSQGTALAASPHPAGTVWHLPTAASARGPRLLMTPSGHAVLYGEHGLRILYLDPGGTPLHECAWAPDPPRPARLLRARLQLDWAQWVGLRPEGLVNSATFDISHKPGWQKLTAKDLQGMAAQSLGVTPEDVAFFYDESSLAMDARGRVTIRHRKDALYLLPDGTFSKPRFMACMGAMRWGRIDFLPVVELFQSLVAGTGSATFELIRALYDDQAAGASPAPLRYRGIPTYPSPQAFQLFSTYFQPVAPGRADPLPLFMDPARSSEVTWRPKPACPLRYMDEERDLCVTVAGGLIQKVTRRHDAVALPYVRPRKDGTAPGGRMAGATLAALQLQDSGHREEQPLRIEWGVTSATPLPEITRSPVPGWQALFPEGAPALDAARAYLAVPLYPDDDTEVDDVGTLALVEEEAWGYVEQLRGRGEPRTRAVLLHNWDAGLAACVDLAQEREYTALYTRPEFAQRQAQRLWDQAASSGHLAGLSRVAFLPADRHGTEAYGRTYGLLYRWIPFDQYRLRAECERQIGLIAAALVSGGAAVLVGPSWLADRLARAALSVLVAVPVTETGGVRIHRTLLPKARINPEATLYLLQKP